MRLIADQITVCGIPSQNPTTPSAVTSLGITPRPGAIAAVWPVPTIRPIGTEYRLMEATVNSYASAAEVWRGDALGAVITKPTTASFYYWLDALASNGSYSTFPGVNSGVVGAANLVATTNITPGATTDLFSINVAGPVEGGTTIGVYGWSVVMSYQVSAYPLNTQHVVTAIGEYEYVRAIGPSEVTGEARIVSDVGSVATDRTIVLTDAVGNYRGSFSIEGIFDISSGSAPTYKCMFQGLLDTGENYYLRNGMLKVEVIKR